MNIPVLIGCVVALIVFRFARFNMLAWLIGWWVVVFAAVRYGIDPPMPSSIISMFMAITTIALITYLLTDSERLAKTTAPLERFLVDRKFALPMMMVVIALPLLVGLKTYLGGSDKILAPVSGRTIHPAPPESITFEGKTIDLIAGNNPYRHLETDEPEKFREHVENGRRVYFQNCVFCHGDAMHGDGIFAHALDPLPANFADPTTIAMLQETYLFWRVAKGAPGLPSESTPWSSAMPAWEKLLTEEEIWDVIIFLYDFTGQKPRATEEHH